MLNSYNPYIGKMTMKQGTHQGWVTTRTQHLLEGCSEVTAATTICLHLADVDTGEDCL